jgi:hypothetical protein
MYSVLVELDDKGEILLNPDTGLVYGGTSRFSQGIFREEVLINNADIDTIIPRFMARKRDIFEEDSKTDFIWKQSINGKTYKLQFT